MDNKYQKSNWIWPQIEDADSARSAAHQGMYAALFVVIGTSILLILSTQGINPLNLTLFSLVDVAIFGLVAWRIRVMSRPAAILGLAFYILGQIITIAQFGFRTSILPIFITLAFINGIRGTFAYHKYTELNLDEGQLSNNVWDNSTSGK